MIHYPMLLIAVKRCLNCLELKDPCVNCKDYFIYYTLHEFCIWLIEQHDYICMAHNMKGFDGVFILRWIIKNLQPTDKPPESIMNGTKILSINYRFINIIDSL